MSEVRSSVLGRSFQALLVSAVLLYGAWFAVELYRPDLLIIGNITVDLVDGTMPTGGAVSYASVVSQALRATSCILTVAGPEADTDVFGDSVLYVIPANETLTFEHTYTWWGHSRKLRVTANPNITISRAHVPWRCRWARVVLLGPLTLHDVDAGSFSRHDGFWEQLLNRRQLVGLMAQGFQRALGPDGEVLPLPAPSQQLLAGLSERVHLFLSDVETDTWSQQDVRRVVSSAAQVIITQGEKGATLLVPDRSSSSSSNGISRERSSKFTSTSSSKSSSKSSSSSSFQEWKIPAVKVPRAVDTNGAGDTFATVYMIAAMRGDPSPGTTASWAASRGVLQHQTCKPRCTPDLIVAPGGVPVITQAERAWIAAVPLAQHVAALVSGPLKQLALLAPGMGRLQEGAERVEQFSTSKDWGRDVSSRLVSQKVVTDLSAMQDARVSINADGSTDSLAAAATAVPHSAAGVQQH